MWCSGRHLEPSKDFMPDLAGERALQDDVVDGFGCLITKQAAWVVLEAAAGEPVRSPASIKPHEPMEEFDFGRRPCLPYHLPSAAGNGSVKRGQVGRLDRKSVV